MGLYLKLRWWVDRNWVEGLGYKTLVAVGIAPFLLVPVVLVPVVGDWWLWPAVGILLGWSLFVGWRGWRVARANDTHYDRKTKYMLSKEYHDSESAMKASFKRKRRKKANWNDGGLDGDSPMGEE